MKTCDRCKHFTQEKWETEFGCCDLMGDWNESPHEIARAYGWDYEGYAAGVYVGVKFGCIHWVNRQ